MNKGLRFDIWLLLAVAIAGFSAYAVDQNDESPFHVSPSVTTDAGNKTIITFSFKVPEGHYLYSDRILISAEDSALTPISIPEPKQKEDPFSGEMEAIYNHDVALVYELSETGHLPLNVTVGFQGCTETLCFLPQSKEFAIGGTVSTPDTSAQKSDIANTDILDGFSIIGRDSGYMNVDDFIEFLDSVESGKGVSENIIQKVLRQHGVVVMVFFILMGGFLLNLTPCVLPMIPVNIAIIGAGTKAGSKARGFALGATYGLGIALVYGVLGLIVVLTGSQFGTLNSSPWFNMAIAIIFLTLSLSMFGVFNIDFSRFQSSGPDAGSTHGPFVTAFAFGGIAALLAGACVAPILIGVLVFATQVYQGGTSAALLLPFVLGLGMALPWPFAGAGLSFLPKPGRWMERIKIGFGVVILGASIYYGQLGARMLINSPSEKASTADNTESISWLTSLDEALAMTKSSGNPLFIDVWATWCKSCIKMSKTTLRDPSVQSRLEPYVRLKFQAEDPNAPEIKPILDALGVKGQPYYVVIKAN